MMPRSAFTLIELLVSVTLAVILVGLAWTGLVQLKRSSERAQVSAELALEGGTLYRRFDADFTRTQQQAQMRLETPALDSTVYGSGARAVRLIAMAEPDDDRPGRDTLGWQWEDAYRNPVVWFAWEWRPPTAVERAADARAAGSLWCGRSSPSLRNRRISTMKVLNTASGNYEIPTDAYGPGVEFYQAVQPLRSRKADPAMNDLSLLPGASHAPLVRLLSDRADLLGEDLDRDGALDVPEDVDGDGGQAPGRMRRVSGRVTACAITWVDRGGWTTTADSAGVQVRDDTGAAITAAGTAWWSGEVRAVDGLYRDARDETVESSRSILAWRPAVVRVALTLYDPRTRLERPLRFAFALDLGVPDAVGR